MTCLAYPLSIQRERQENVLHASVLSLWISFYQSLLIRRLLFLRLVSIVGQDAIHTIGVNNLLIVLSSDFESKKPKTESHKNTATSADKLTPMPIGYIEKPANLNPPTPAFEPIQVDVPLPATMPTAASSLKRTSEEMMFSPMDSILTMHEALTPLDEDLKLKEDELRSMLDFDNMTKQTVNTVNDTLPDEMNVNDILFELQRQTVHSMMDELVNISDILAASQLDVYSNNESDLPFLDLGFESFQAANEL